MVKGLSMSLLKEHKEITKMRERYRERERSLYIHIASLKAKICENNSLEGLNKRIMKLVLLLLQILPLFLFVI
jgi:hypothetical protein